MTSPFRARTSHPSEEKDEPSARPYFSPAALRFLRGIARNNRRDWFDPRKQIYQSELKAPMLALVAEVNQAMESFSPEHVQDPRKCIMRIYRDTRFSADKRPYKNQVAAWWSPAELPRTSGAGFYFHVSAKEVVIAAGLYMPDREQLLAVRTFLLEQHVLVRSLLNDRKLRRQMELFSGNPLTRPPRGFPREHPAMDLVLQRQWGVESTLPAEAALRPDFPKIVIRLFRLAAPLVRALNTPLLAGPGERPRPLFGLPEPGKTT